MTTDTFPRSPAAPAGPPGVGRDRKGRRDDRARHGDPDRPRSSPTPPSSCRAARRRCSGGSWTAPSTRSSIDTDTSTSDTAAIMASGAAGPVEPSRASKRRCIRRPRPDPADRPRRRGRDEAARGQRHRRSRRCAGEASREGDRELTAREDGRPRRRSQLGTGGDGDRQVLGRHRHRRAPCRDPVRSAGAVPASGRRQRPCGAHEVPRTATTS